MMTISKKTIRRDLWIIGLALAFVFGGCAKKKEEGPQIKKVPAKPEQSQPAKSSVQARPDSGASDAADSAGGFAQRKEPETKDTRRVDNKDEGYSIEFPNSWKVGKKATALGVAMIGTSLQEGPYDKFLENAIITVINVPPSMDDKYLLKRGVDAISQIIPEMMIVQQGKTTISQLPASYYMFTSSGKNLESKGVLYLIPYRDKLYIMAFTAEQSQFDKFRPTVKTIAHSMEIVK